MAARPGSCQNGRSGRALCDAIPCRPAGLRYTSLPFPHAPLTTVNPSDSTPSIQPPRFVEHPARRRAWRAGQRNLAWGTAFFCAALCVLGIAVFSGGASAAVPLVLCVVVFTALWVLARMKVFSQRNGVFFALAVIALLGSGAGLVEQAWMQLSGRQPRGLSQPNVTVENSRSAASVPIPISGAPELPYLVEALSLETPSPALPRVRALKDITTQIGAKTYRIRKGDLFLFADEKPGKFMFSANDYLATVPSDSMELLGPERSKDSGPDRSVAEPPISTAEKIAAAQVTKRAQEQAVRRFPALGRAGSPENRTYLAAYNDLKTRRSPMLEEPEWPLHLAESLAQRNNWEEAPDATDSVGEPIGKEPEVVEPGIAPGTKMLAEPPRAVPVQKEQVPPPILPDDNGPLPPPPTPPQ
jgi:hypothetical protein